MGVKNKKVVLVDVHGMNGGAEKVLLALNEILHESFKSVCFFPKNSFMSEKKMTKNVLNYDGVFNLAWKISKEKADIVVLNNKTALKYLLILKIFLPKSKIIFYSHSFFRTNAERMFYDLLCVPFLYKVICVSDSLRRNHTFNLKKHLDKHIKIYNGFDYKYPDTVKKQKDNIKIFFWAQFRVWKGHLFFIDVLNSISKINDKIELHLVANIQDAESKKVFELIKQKIKQYNLENIVYFHLDISNHLHFINENADISVSCSNLKDPLPTVIIESLSMGLPILAVNLGGSKEILKEFPFMLSSFDENEFADKLNFLINELSNLEKQKLQEYYRLNFTKDIYKKNIINFFQNL
ncbi:glycosyltransferase family 4 protein [Tenacibaculum sp. MEBiC06402]|uniref:glycosyltransferase family 4 protein n=1 Tax=unclassified Tenacibaculum TaxID=2635139 RepID=UPI003B9B3257